VLIGNGDGTFQPRLDLGTGGDPMGLAVADVDGDSHPDLVVANGDRACLSILRGRAGGR
jgi:hypothetical protein